jgi:hypothetical protein
MSYAINYFDEFYIKVREHILGKLHQIELNEQDVRNIFNQLFKINIDHYYTNLQINLDNELTFEGTNQNFIEFNKKFRKYIS